jgi:hypothetical protein
VPSLVFAALFAVALLLMAIPGKRKVIFAGTILLCLTALASAGWTLNGYMATISPSWSQAGLWDAYYAQCTPTDPPPGAHPSAPSQAAHAASSSCPRSSSSSARRRRSSALR